MADPRIQVPSNCELTLGMVCIDKSQPGRTVWKMLADERFANPAGIVQGGFLAAFADSAMGSATVTFATARQTRVFSANVEMKTSFMAPARVGEMLECAAEVVSGGTRRGLRRGRGDRQHRTAAVAVELHIPVDAARAKSVLMGLIRRWPTWSGRVRIVERA